MRRLVPAAKLGSNGGWRFYNGGPMSLSSFASGAKLVIDLIRSSARDSAEQRRNALFQRKRVTLSEFVGLAVTSYGWSLDNGSSDFIDLANGIRQAAVDGDLTIYGRRGCRDLHQEYWDQFPIQRISAEHFHEYAIQIIPAMGGQNRDAQTYQLDAQRHDQACFVDLWLDRREALRWLRSTGESWKGRTDAMRSRH